MSINNFYDEAFTGITQTVADVSQSIADEFKGTESFNKKETPMEELYYWFTQTGEDERNLLKQKFGFAYDELVSDLQQFRLRRGI